MLRGTRSSELQIFQSGSDPLVADKGKEDIGSILSLIGMDPVQRNARRGSSRGDSGLRFDAL